MAAPKPRVWRVNGPKGPVLGGAEEGALNARRRDHSKRARETHKKQLAQDAWARNHRQERAVA